MAILGVPTELCGSVSLRSNRSKPFNSLVVTAAIYYSPFRRHVNAFNLGDPIGMSLTLWVALPHPRRYGVGPGRPLLAYTETSIDNVYAIQRQDES